MPDNVGITPGSGAKAASREVSYSGETAQVQVVGLATFAGADDAKTVADVSSANPLPTQEAGGAMSLLIHLAQARLATLNGAKATATARGDAERVAELDAEIAETETTLAALRGIS